MKLSEALSKIYPAQGATTLMAALLSGDGKSIKSPDIIGKGIEQLEAELKKAEEDQNNCGSDWAYWGYEGTISYLKSAIWILMAADIVGENNLADVPEINRSGVVMDVQGRVEDFGRKIYTEAVKARELAKIIAEREINKKKI